MMNISRSISSDLSVIEEKPHKNHSGPRLVIDDKIYVALTPDVYAWLRRQMEKAHSAYQSGHLQENRWNVLRERFCPVHGWVIDTWGKEVVARSMKKNQPNPFIVTNHVEDEPNPIVGNSKGKPPDANQHQDSSHRYPATGEYPCIHPVSPEAVTQVNAIKDRALSLGWTQAGLYQNRGRFKWLCGQDYGLVCFLGNGETIGEITRQSIEIIKPSGVHHRFYNRDVNQPWIKKYK